MKGKIAFVLGAAVGYVLGTRAGRARYEQIKQGAETLWNTAPVQRGVSAVQGVAQERIDELKAAATRAGKNAVASFLRDDSASESSATASSSGGAESGARTKSGSGAKSTPKPKAGDDA